jgi:tellurite resistance protein TerB
MPNRLSRNRLGVTQAELVTAAVEYQHEHLLDALATAAALVARADGWIDAAERSHFLGFMSRNGILSVFERSDVLDAFEYRVAQLNGDGGAQIAAASLRRITSRSQVRLVVDAAEYVAAADGHVHTAELHVLKLIRVALSARPGQLQAFSQ